MNARHKAQSQGGLTIYVTLFLLCHQVHLGDAVFNVTISATGSSTFGKGVVRNITIVQDVVTEFVCAATFAEQPKADLSFTVRWQNGGNVLEEVHETPDGRRLQVQLNHTFGRAGHSSNLECIIQTRSSFSASDAIKLLVVGPPDPPTISFTGMTGSLEAGKETNVTCDALNGFPAPMLHWYLVSSSGNHVRNITDNATLPQATTEHGREDVTSTLRFVPRLNHRGSQLECRAIVIFETPSFSSNQSDAVDLPQILSTQDLPKNVRVLRNETTSSSLRIAWRPGHDGGLPQIFSVAICSNEADDVTMVTSACNTTNNVTENDFTLSDLKPFHRYRVSVDASNRLGTRTRFIDTSTAPLSPQQYGITCANTKEDGLVNASAAIAPPQDVPDGVCFIVITKSSPQTTTCPSQVREECVDPGAELIVSDAECIGLMTWGRGLCSVPSIYVDQTSVTEVESPRDDHVMLMVVIGCVLGSSILLLLTTGTAVILFFFFCKKIKAAHPKMTFNSRQVDKDGLVYVSVQHESPHPLDAAPIRTERQTVYATLDMEATTSGKYKVIDGNMVSTEGTNDTCQGTGGGSDETTVSTKGTNDTCQGTGGASDETTDSTKGTNDTCQGTNNAGTATTCADVYTNGAENGISGKDTCTDGDSKVTNNSLGTSGIDEANSGTAMGSTGGIDNGKVGLHLGSNSADEGTCDNDGSTNGAPQGPDEKSDGDQSLDDCRVVSFTETSL